MFGWLRQRREARETALRESQQRLDDNNEATQRWLEGAEADSRARKAHLAAQRAARQERVRAMSADEHVRRAARYQTDGGDPGRVSRELAWAAAKQQTTTARQESEDCDEA